MEQFRQLRELRPSDFDSVVDYQIELLASVTDEDYEVIEDLSLIDLSNYVKVLKWLNGEPHSKHSERIGEFTFIPCRQLTWGQFIDLEHYCGQGYYEHITTICGIFARKIREDEWGHQLIEPYKYDPVERGKLFDTFSITSIYGVMSGYLTYRKNIMKKYEHLFEPELPEQDEEMDAEDRKTEEQAKRFARWSFESVTLQLAGGDRTKMDDIFNMKLIKVLNLLAMSNDLGGV